MLEVELQLVKQNELLINLELFNPFIAIAITASSMALEFRDLQQIYVSRVRIPFGIKCRELFCFNYLQLRDG